MTAEEFVKYHIHANYNFKGFDKAEFTGIDMKKMMINFAKHHVKEALKTASEVADTTHLGGGFTVVDEKTILNSYPLENIK